MECMTSPPTPAGSAWAPTTTPQHSPSRPSAAGGTPWAPTPTHSIESIDHRRRWWIQQLPHQTMEDRTGHPRRPNGPEDHGLPPTTWHQQMEQDRAPPVLPHLHELARPATDQPRSHRANHRCDHHPRRTERPRRTRHQHLPHRAHHPRLHDEGAVRIRHPHPPRMAPGLELQPETTHKLSVLIIGKPYAPI